MRGHSQHSIDRIGQHPGVSLEVSSFWTCGSLAVAADFASSHFEQTVWQWSAGLLTVGCMIALAVIFASSMELSCTLEGAAMRAAYLHMGMGASC